MPHRNVGSTLITQAAPKIMPFILFCWSMMSEADDGGMAAEAGISCQYSIAFHYCVTDGIGGTI